MARREAVVFDRGVATVAARTHRRRERLLDRPRVRRAAGRFARIGERETDFDVRGFAACPPAVRAELELHGRSFASGFNAAVAHADLDELAAALDGIPTPERGFAYEGAGMGLALFDIVGPRAERLARFLDGHAAPHVYLVHVGAGWALARLRQRPWRRLALDPLLRWLALDGYGFHDAFFRPAEIVRGHAVSRRLNGYQRRVFDQGVGRALWFVDGAEPDRVAATVESFPQDRRADLWSGVALAAAYAGSAGRAEYERLVDLCRAYRPHVAQGVAFAAAARVRAGAVTAATERACETVLELDARRAAAVTDEALQDVPRDGSGEAYEAWRAGIRARFDTP